MRDASVHQREESILSLLLVIHDACRNVYDLNNIFDLVLNIKLGSLNLHIVSLSFWCRFKIN